MSINKLISIRNPIVDALDLVGADRSVDMPVFTTWAIQAEKEIYSTPPLKRNRAVLDIVGCRAAIPCCVLKLEGAIMGDHGCDCGNLFDNCFLGGNIFINGETPAGMLIVDYDPSASGSATGFVAYQIQDNHIVFNNNYDGQKVTIQYKGYEEDEHGFIMISENHVRAITEYILWKYGVRSEYTQKQLSLQSTMTHRQEWFRLCKHSRAMDNMLNDSERAEINNLVNDPYKGRGFWVGMEPTGLGYW